MGGTRLRLERTKALTHVSQVTLGHVLGTRIEGEAARSRGGLALHGPRSYCLDHRRREKRSHGSLASRMQLQVVGGVVLCNPVRRAEQLARSIPSSTQSESSSSFMMFSHSLRSSSTPATPFHWSSSLLISSHSLSASSSCS
jgi:hypothetical protein